MNLNKQEISKRVEDIRLSLGMKCARVGSVLVDQAKLKNPSSSAYNAYDRFLTNKDLNIDGLNKILDLFAINSSRSKESMIREIFK